jgi:hypothetical protein
VSFPERTCGLPGYVSLEEPVPPGLQIPIGTGSKMSRLEPPDLGDNG